MGDSILASKTGTIPAADESTGTTANTNSTSCDSAASFVDYVPPPAVKILPPAKYKLWLIVFVLVYFASWVSADAKFLQFLRFEGWLSFEASFFLLLGTIVFVLVYATMDLVITCLTFTTADKKVYGIGAWLKQPRAQWMYHHENIVLEVLARVVHILEEGFSMFDAPPVNHINAGLASKTPTPFECSNHACHRILKIEHRIRPDKLDEYKKWSLRIKEAVAAQNGLLGTDNTEITAARDEEEGRTTANPTPTNNTTASKTTTTDTQDNESLPQLHVIHVKFANIDYLNDWMLSPRRKALIKALEPLLDQPDVVQVQGNRALPDAFSDLLTRQGAAVPKSPPKKWKVWWLTLVALYITQQWGNSFLPYYFDFWGLTEADARLERLVSVFIVTFLNSYVMTPLFLFVFDHWLQHSDVVAKNTRQPWKTLDEGFTLLWPKVLITFAFYGGCVIVILLEKYA